MLILQEHDRPGMEGAVETITTVLGVYNCKEQPASKFLSVLAKHHEHADRSVRGDKADFIQAICSLAEMEVYSSTSWLLGHTRLSENIFVVCGGKVYSALDLSARNAALFFLLCFTSLLLSADMDLI